MKFLSPAKVNLHLQVLERRPDGHHEIQTLMHRVALFDEVEIQREGRGISLTTEGEGIPGGKENLVWRATEIFCQEAGIQPHFRIRIRKRIPVAAGLGGGSGNAATVLLALNDLLQAGMEEGALMALGARIGADVPFFVFQKSALARGKGDVLTPVRLPETLWFLLLVPPFRISTAWAYEAYDRMAGGKKSATVLKDTYSDLDALCPVLKNDLELPALSRYPEIGRRKEELVDRGARGALMSGSGPAIFGIFPDQKEAERAAQTLVLPPGWKTEIVQGI